MPRILVADDDRIIRAMLRRMLEKAGHEVDEAASSEEAVSRFEQAPACLAFVDLFIPTEGGLTIIQRLREARPGVRIIAISGGAISMGEVRQEVNLLEVAKRSGADRVFKKPFGEAEILGAVKELLAGDD